MPEEKNHIVRNNFVKNALTVTNLKARIVRIIQLTLTLFTKTDTTQRTKDVLEMFQMEHTNVHPERGQKQKQLTTIDPKTAERGGNLMQKKELPRDRGMEERLRQ